MVVVDSTRYDDFDVVERMPSDGRELALGNFVVDGHWGWGHSATIQRNGENTDGARRSRILGMYISAASSDLISNRISLYSICPFRRTYPDYGPRWFRKSSRDSTGHNSR